MTNINDFDSSLLNIDEISFKSDELIMYDIKYLKNLNSLKCFEYFILLLIIKMHILKKVVKIDI